MTPRAVQLIAPLAAAVAAAVVAPASVTANTYTVHSCKTPVGDKAQVGWKLETLGPSGYGTRDDCPTGGAFRIELASTRPHPSSDYIRAAIYAPANTEIGAYSVWWSGRIRGHYHLGFRERTPDGRSIQVENCFAESGCFARGNPSNPLAPANLSHAAGLSGVIGLQVVATCGYLDTSSSKCEEVAPAAEADLHRADVTIVDNFAPALAQQPSGPLLESTPDRPLVGEQPVSLWATDRGGGVHEVLFEVDGQVVDRKTIDDNGGQCQTPFAVARPCPVEVGRTVTFDTSRIPDGEHALKLRITDATGANSVEWGPVPIFTSNSTCAPRPRAAGLTMRAAFAGRGKPRRKIVVRYGRRPWIRGRLSTAAGAPVADATVCVAARSHLARMSLRPSGTVRSNPKGRFRYRLPRGPSRRVYFVFRTPSGAAAASVVVRVRAPVRLRASRRRLRNGDTVALAGKVRRPIPRRGVLVEIQARRGREWRTFGTARSNRAGRFRFPYRFTRTLGRQRYALRARVPRQNAYPYVAGASRPVTLTVSG